jgi:FkbM family methyltransferase
MKQSISPRGHAAIRNALVAIVASLVTWTVTAYYYQHSLEASYSFVGNDLAELAKRYGPSRYSEHAEEWIIRDYFNDRHGGVFLDVGANDYKFESNTYFLEKELGWSGIAIDALAQFAPDYQRFRPRTTFVTAFVSDKTGVSVPFFVPDGNTAVSSSDRAFANLAGATTRERQVTTTTLDAVLDERAIEHVDFMSMDIELSEPKALAGFAIERFRPAFVCVEAHPMVRQAILDYFAAHRYVVVGKYLRADPINLYFQPGA